MFMAYRNLRTVLVLTLILLVVVSGALSVTPPPPVQACNTCNFLLTWGSSGPGSGQFNFTQTGPSGIAVDSSGNVYVVDGGNYRVELFGDSTSPVPEFSTVAVVAFSALATSLYLLRRRRT